MSNGLFWVGLWALAGAAGTLRALRDSDYRDCHSLAAVGLYSGMVGFGSCAIVAGGFDGHIGHELRYLGMSTFLGLMGKEQDRVVRYVVSKGLEKFGVPKLPGSEIVLGDSSVDDQPVDSGDSPDI